MRKGLAGFSGTFVGMVLALSCMGSMAAPGTARSIQSAFETNVHKTNVKPGTSSITVEWNYTNPYDFPLVVERIEESCGCLRGKKDQEEVKPGATGQIHAEFNPGTFRGTLRKSLHVRFVGHDKPVELVLEAVIPSSVQLSSYEINWPVGEKPVARIIEVTAGTDAPFNITGLVGVAENQFVIQQQTVTKGRHYRLTITPATGAGSDIQCLQVRTDSPDPRDRVLAVFLRAGTSPSKHAVPIESAPAAHSKTATGS
jgi:hypothetical protein